MNLSAADRNVLATLCPDVLIGVADADLDDTLDQWFARDHYEHNPVYTWNDESECSEVVS
jgi:hypothetical protein